IVVPMPTAGPHTAATMGFGKALMARKKRHTGDSCEALGRSRKSAMSLPALKIVSCPWNTTTRTATSASACTSASAMAAYIGREIEFFFSTRFRVMVITPSVWSINISFMALFLIKWGIELSQTTFYRLPEAGQIPQGLTGGLVIVNQDL